MTYGSFTIPYDAAGRPTQWPVERPGYGYGLADMNWDYEGRLTQMKVPTVGQPFTTNYYNGVGTRVKRVDAYGAATQQFRRDGIGVTAPVLSSSTGPSYNQTWTRHTPGISQTTGSTTTFQHAGIKNADAQSTSGTAVSATRDYDAWGNVIASTGSFTGRFGYGGAFGYQEEDSGLKLLGHRFYDPNAGRFLTRDRIKDGRNWYAYCDNNPLKRADPSGLVPVVVILSAVAIVIALAALIKAIMDAMKTGRESGNIRRKEITKMAIETSESSERTLDDDNSQSSLGSPTGRNNDKFKRGLDAAAEAAEEGIKFEVGIVQEIISPTSSLKELAEGIVEDARNDWITEQLKGRPSEKKRLIHGGALRWRVHGSDGPSWASRRFSLQ